MSKNSYFAPVLLPHIFRLVCEDDKIFHPCPCYLTCSDLAKNVTCQSTPEECVPGCVCPTGTVEHNGDCITSIECPCYHDGKFYEVCQYLLCIVKSKKLKLKIHPLFPVNRTLMLLAQIMYLSLHCNFARAF